MLLFKGYCAGILVFQQESDEASLDRVLKQIEQDLKDGNYSIQFGVNTIQTVTEVCVDVYEVNPRYRLDLSKAFKN